jgi:hypothetical protein
MTENHLAQSEIGLSWRGRHLSWLHLGWVFLLLCGAVGLVVPVVHLADTSSYADNSVTRPPGYPLVIDLAQTLAGAQWARLVVWWQFLACGAAIWQFSGILRQHLQLPRPVYWFVVGVLLIALPTWGPGLITEAFSYALYLAFFGALLQSCFAKPLYYTAQAALWATLMVATKSQLGFMAAVLAAHGLVLLLVWRRALLLPLAVALAVAAAALGNGAQVLSNGLHHGLYTRAALSGLPVFGLQLYLSSPADQALLTDPADKAYVATIHTKMAEQKLFRTSLPGTTDSPEGFQTIGDRILYGVLMPMERDKLGVVDLNAQQTVELDTRALRIAKVWMAHRPGAWVRHALQHARTMSGFFILLAVLVAMSAPYLAWRQRHPWGFVLALIAATAAGNHVLISFVHVTQQRYVFIPDLLLIAALLATMLQLPPQPSAAPAPDSEPA